MPHSQLSTRNERGERVCPYCGAAIRTPNPYSEACTFHRDLPALEPFDDRYTLTEPE